MPMNCPVVNSRIVSRHHTPRSRQTSTTMSCKSHHSQHCTGVRLIYVIMGVCGCGKSTVGELLALKLSCKFYDADAYHPAANISKMAAGIPLTDEDRLPWLQQLADVLHSHVTRNFLRCVLCSNTHAVLACSALKPAYRQLLRMAEHPQASTAAEQACNTAAATTPAGTNAGVPTLQHSSIVFVLLNPPPEELLLRMQRRVAAGSHFMPPSLLQSQLQQLEYTEDEMYMVFSGSGQVAEGIVEAILAQTAAAALPLEGLD